MVHIKRVELTNFKSFGGTTAIPLLSGFTVVSGPNGSGKSNILDALLFCLGLASSKGMRAERLPDLVNHNKEHRGTVETSVTVTFDLSDVSEAASAGSENQSLASILTTSLGIEGGADGLGKEFNEDLVTNNGHHAEPSPDDEVALTNGNRNTDTEWSVTRRLRVTKQGNYTSNYYINGEPCTQTELHERLNELRVYPEGYNVVLQGDVTSIISMNSRERREIIDELAGVAAFDRKIVQAKGTLEAVKEREDSCRIIERELLLQRDRLSQDRIKAEKYQKLRLELQTYQQWEAVLVWRSLQKQEWNLSEQLAAGGEKVRQLTEYLTHLSQEISQATTHLEQLNIRVKALGEEESLSIASNLATQQAEQRQLQRRQQELQDTTRQTEANIKQTEEKIQQYRHTLAQLSAEQQPALVQLIATRQHRTDEAQAALEQSREQASAIADASDVWVQQQTALTRQIETLLQTIDPQRTEQARLRERSNQVSRQLTEQTELLQSLEPEIATKQTQSTDLEGKLAASTQTIQSLAQSLANAEQERLIQQQTQTRLLSEQRDKQRQLDKLEATAQAQQEAQGTYATKIILNTGVPGVCGLVVQLGRVEPQYQLALSTAAGGRLGNIVVEDDSVAAMGIELLKQKRAGRATFLPLNKLQSPRFSDTAALRYANGFIDYAINLIDSEPRYKNVFAYVFGNTVVFDSLNSARSYLGKYRIVTLDGEILEASGAMTGGSSNQRSALSFGTAEAGESAELAALRNRLQEIERILERCDASIYQASAAVKQLSGELTEAKTQRREQELRFEQLQKDIGGLMRQQEQTRSLLAQYTQELTTAQSRLQTLDIELPAQEAQLQQWRQQLAELEQSQTHSEWQQIQATIKGLTNQLNEREQALREAEKQLQDLENQQQRLQEKTVESQRQLSEYQQQKSGVIASEAGVREQLAAINQQLVQTQTQLSQLEQHLGEAKQERDTAEQQLRERQLSHQQQTWELQKLQETTQERREALVALQSQLEAARVELPEPLPAVPEQLHLEQLQKETRSLTKRLQAMEPVNMLALTEYDRTQERLQELSDKLATLEAERTEILLRVENFTTLRFRAFKEAFDAINENFQKIFAELSDGDGYLQLDDPENPFSGGLNLVAHPKGKPVQRLASMSGGEKSLTALSFIFALQRFRPSPFYAFDEVDMFLDGANVERLARMIKQQATLAQFIVVSLRRPMIESSERAIGVTQARGAYTQVLGLKLQPRSAIR
jgi:chromosome segregation protein